MKRLLSYILLVMLTSAFFTSCIFEQFEDVDRSMVTTMTLQLSFPTKASTDKTFDDGTESGSDYENRIPRPEDINIFIFEQKGKHYKYRGQATNLELYFKDDPEKYVKGNLPDSLLKANVRMVFMANYGYRTNSLKAPDNNQNFDAWAKKQSFTFSNEDNFDLLNNTSDGRLIPFSGIVDFKVKKDNFVNIDIHRALAKVRICVKETSGYGIQNINVHNTSGEVFCFQQYGGNNSITPGTDSSNDDIIIPNTAMSNGGSDRVFSGIQLYPNPDKKEGIRSSIEFYAAEQLAENDMYISFELFNKDNPSEVIPEQAHFRFYHNGDTKDQNYNIRRNWIYEFRIGKKADESHKVDISTGIEPWTIHDLSTDYE